MPAIKKNRLPAQNKLAVPSIRIVEVEAPTLSPEIIPELLREINDRQFSAVLEVLLEAKFKAEAMLRTDTVFDSAFRLSYYQGWVAYADYILGSLIRLRSQQSDEPEEPQPGPD